MALACPRCATLNPDTNAFCQNCGAALGVAAAPGQQPQPAPVQAAPPRPAPAQRTATAMPPVAPGAPTASYYATTGQSQFYAPPPPPPGGGGPVHRLPRNAIYAIIAAAVLVIAGVGAIVVLAGKPSPHTPVVPTVPTSSATPQPQPTSGPTSAPTSPPGPAPPSGNTINAGFAVVPQIPGFTAQSPTNNNLELDANDKSGQVFVQLSGAAGVTSNQQLADALLASDQKSSPDATRCQPDKNGGTFAGAGGAKIPAQVIAICETFTPQNGQAFPAIDLYFAGIAKDSSGSPVAIVVNLFASKDSYNNFAKEVPDAFYNGIQFNATP